MKLENIKCFLLDMDGTIYLGDKLIDGSLEFIETIKNQGKKFLFLTNNSSKNKLAYKEKLESLGIKVSEEEVFSSGEATTIYLNKIKPGAKVFLLGTPLLEEEFIKSGFQILKDRKEKPDFVVLGFDTTLTYEKLWIACDFIRDGVEYIATHPDFNCPLEDNKFMPDTGAMIKMIEGSTGKTPLVIGKPEKHIIDSIIEKYDLKKEELAMVGDRLYTDIAVGKNAGITSILVMSGETTEEMYKESEIVADYKFLSIKELNDKLNEKQ